MISGVVVEIASDDVDASVGVFVEPREEDTLDWMTKKELECHDPAPIFHFPPPQVFPTTPSALVTQPARAQQTPV